ncbi:MAG: FCD domain-containing protein, partial [Microbacterium sp.]
VAARRATPTDVETLRGMIDAADVAREATDHEAFLQDDHAIHLFLVRMVRNTLLQDAAERLLQHNLRFWRGYWESRPAQNATMISHRPLLEALQAHDSEGAEKAMREHLTASRQLLQKSL